MSKEMDLLLPAIQPSTDNVAGWWGGLRNSFLREGASLTAIGLICLMFYQDRHAALEQAKEDRVMYRQEIRESREQHDKQIRGVEASLRELAAEIRQWRAERK